MYRIMTLMQLEKGGTGFIGSHGENIWREKQYEDVALGTTDFVPLLPPSSCI